MKMKIQTGILMLIELSVGCGDVQDDVSFWDYTSSTYVVGNFKHVCFEDVTQEGP